MKQIYLSGIVDGKEEEDAILEVLRSRWHTEGKYTTQFQNELAECFRVKYAVATNSGTSANILALAGLNLPKDSVILSSAAGFSATLAPIIHLGYKPFLVDYDLDTLNIDINQIEQALKTTKIDAMLIAHTLGSSLDMYRLIDLQKKYGFKLIEDCCESYKTYYDGKAIGGFGDLGTLSFFPSHTMNGMGSGGAVLTNNEEIYNRIKSLKSWGKSNVREGEYFTKFSSVVDGIPYDEGYTYTTIGYNMRMTDLQAAYLIQQLKRLPGFVKRRQENYLYLHNTLQNLPLRFMKWPKESFPAFFGFPIVLKEDGIRDKLVEYLESKGIRTRLFFGGNLLRHPAYKTLQYDSLDNGVFPVADYLMKNAFFCGCWPGLTIEDMEYTSNTIKEFFSAI